MIETDGQVVCVVVTTLVFLLFVLFFIGWWQFGIKTVLQTYGLFSIVTGGVVGSFLLAAWFWGFI